MKHPVRDLMKKNCPVALPPVIAAVVVGFLFSDAFSLDAPTAHQFFYILVVFGGGFAGLAALLFGLPGLVGGYGFGLLLSLYRILYRTPWFRYLGFALFLGLACFCLIHEIQETGLALWPTGKSRKRPLTKLKLLRRINLWLHIAISAVNLSWFFLPVPYKLFSFLSMLLFLVTLAVAVCFPSHADLSGSKKKNRCKVDMTGTLVFASAPSVLRTAVDFNLREYAPFLLWFLGIGTALCLLFRVFLPRFQARKDTFLTTAVLIFLFSFGAVGQLNYLLDTAEPVFSSAAVTDMYITNKRRQPTRYTLVLSMEDGETDSIHVSRMQYFSISIGSTITLQTSRGGLGISYETALIPIETD